MPHYRLYRLNPHSGHIDQAEDLHASDDVEAIHRIEGLDRPVNMELGRGSRKVRRFDAPPNVFQRRQSGLPLRSRQSETSREP